MNFNDDEYVETSDVEELAEIERERAAKLARIEAQKDIDPSTRPLKRIKLSHDGGQDDAHTVSWTPIKDLGGEDVAETPTRSQSLTTVSLDMSTSPTKVSDSPERKITVSAAGGLDAREPTPFLMEPSQDPLLLRTPTRGDATTKSPGGPRSPLRTPLQPSPFLQTNTPLQSPKRPSSKPPVTPITAGTNQQLPIELQLFTPPPPAQPTESLNQGEGDDEPNHVEDIKDVPMEDIQGQALFSSPPPEPSQNGRSSSSSPSPSDSVLQSPRAPSVPASSRHSPPTSPSLASHVSDLPNGPEVEDQQRFDPALYQEGRTLRPRTTVQKNPFTVLDGRYKRQMKDIPEAIVPIRHGGGRRRDRSDDEGMGEEEESQDAAFVVDEDEAEDLSDGEGRRRRRRSRSQSEGVVQGEAGVDAEERKRRKELERAEKAKRREEREKRRAEKEREKREREQRNDIKRRTVAGISRDVPPVAGPSRERGTRSPAAQDSPPGFPSHNAMDSDGLTPPPPVTLNLHLGWSPPHADSDDDMEPLPPSTRSRSSISNPQPTEVLSVSSDSDQSQASQPRSLSNSRPRSPTPAQPLIPDDSSDSDVAQRQPLSESEADEEGDLEAKKKILYKMYPRGLADQLLHGQAKAKAKANKKRQREVSSGPGGDSPIKPGQSKRRMGAHNPYREIKGDTESEDEAPPNARTPSPSPPPQAGPSRRSITPIAPSPPRSRRRRSQSVVVHKPKYEFDSTDESEIEEIHDFAIERLTSKARSKGKSSDTDRVKEERFLIDYMLQKTVVFKDRRSSTSSKRKRKSQPTAGSQAKLNIVTSGARRIGNGKQTMLSHHEGFSREAKGKQSSHRRGKGSGSRSGDPTAPILVEDTDDGSGLDDSSDDDGVRDPDRVDEVGAEGDSKRSKREREKAKKARIKAQGLSVFKPQDGGAAKIIVGGLKRREAVTVDLEADALYHDGLVRPGFRAWEGPPVQRLVAAPNPDSHRLEATRSRRRSASISFSDEPSRPASPSNARATPVTEVSAQPELFPILKDSGITLLAAGMSFGTDTYIRSGLLQSLLTTLEKTAAIPAPTSLRPSLATYQIGSGDSVDTVCTVINDALGAVFDFAAAGLPHPDEDAKLKDWTHINHHIGQALSHRLANGDEVTRSRLVETVSSSVIQLVSRIEGLQLSRAGLDVTVFQAVWIAIELSARLEVSVLNARGQLDPASPLTSSIQLLVNQLLLFGLETTMKPLFTNQATQALSATNNASCSTEMWVRLIHLISILDKKEQPGGKRPYIFWQFILTSFSSTISRVTPDISFYEDFWRSLFSLCALSHFSVAGMVTSNPKPLPAAWDLVRWICETTLKTRDEDVAIRDSYVRYLLGRCFILCERWQWKALDISGIVQLFVDQVFSPRKFANLTEEKTEYPGFLLAPFRDGAASLNDENQDKDLMTFDPKDSAYVLLLKFIFRASREPGIKPSVIKKLVSLAAPASKAQFQSKTPTVGEISMVINRITGAIMSVHLNPPGSQLDEAFTTKVSQILDLIPFSEANDQTRLTLIRGLRYWMRFIKLRRGQDMSIGRLVPWIRQMAECFGKEWGKGKGKEARHWELLTKGLLRVVCDECQTSKVHDPSLLLALEPLLVVARQDHDIKRFIHGIVDVVTDNWSAVYPPDRPQVHEAPVEEESQNMYDIGGGIDWNDAALTGELDAVFGDICDNPPSEEVPQEDPRSKHQAQWIALAATGLVEFLFQEFKQSMEREDPMEASGYLSSWVACTLLGTSERPEEVIGRMTREVDNWMKPGNFAKTSQYWRTMVDIMLVLSILRHHPMASTFSGSSTSERILRCFLQALVAVDDKMLPLHMDLGSLVLSLGHPQHFFLQYDFEHLPGQSGFLNRDFTRTEFLQLRVRHLEAIFTKVEAFLADSNPDANKSVGLVSTIIFSTLRSNLRHLEKSQQNERFADYAVFCKQVQGLMKEKSKLVSRGEMGLWKQDDIWNREN